MGVRWPENGGVSRGCRKNQAGSPTGLLIYEGNLLPPQYRGATNPHGSGQARSPAVRRRTGGTAALLHGVAEWESGPVLTDLARKWTGDDRWYLEALGIGMQGIEAQMWERLRKALLADDPRLFKLAWRLRVPEALPFLVSAMKAGNRLALGDHRLTTVNSGALTTVNQAC